MKLRRREGETMSAFLYRFNKRVRQSGILVEAKKRKHKKRAVSKKKRQLSAFYRERKNKEMEKAKKMGTV